MPHKPPVEKVQDFELRRGCKNHDGAGARFIPSVGIALHNDDFGVRICFIQLGNKRRGGNVDDSLQRTPF